MFLHNFTSNFRRFSLSITRVFLFSKKVWHTSIYALALPKWIDWLWRLWTPLVIVKDQYSHLLHFSKGPTLNYSHVKGAIIYPCFTSSNSKRNSNQSFLNSPALVESSLKSSSLKFWGPPTTHKSLRGSQESSQTFILVWDFFCPLINNFLWDYQKPITALLILPPKPSLKPSPS